MKTFLIFFVLTFVTVNISAQDISLTPQDRLTMNRFYADLVGKTATLNGDWGLFGGMRVGYNINKNFINL